MSWEISELLTGESCLQDWESERSSRENVKERKYVIFN